MNVPYERNTVYMNTSEIRNEKCVFPIGKNIVGHVWGRFSATQCFTSTSDAYFLEHSKQVGLEHWHIYILLSSSVDLSFRPDMGLLCVQWASKSQTSNLVSPYAAINEALSFCNPSHLQNPTVPKYGAARRICCKQGKHIFISRIEHHSEHKKTHQHFYIIIFIWSAVTFGDHIPSLIHIPISHWSILQFYQLSLC
jgi:hypothetical protein